MDTLTEYSKNERRSRVNKAQSPIVENNYKARANRVHEEDLERPYTEERPYEVERKVSKVVGLGRHRSLVPEGQASFKDEPVHVEEQVEVEDVPQTSLLCGCL